MPAYRIQDFNEDAIKGTVYLVDVKVFPLEGWGKFRGYGKRKIQTIFRYMTSLSKEI